MFYFILQLVLLSALYQAIKTSQNRWYAVLWAVIGFVIFTVVSLVAAGIANSVYDEGNFVSTVANVNRVIDIVGYFVLVPSVLLANVVPARRK